MDELSQPIPTPPISQSSDQMNSSSEKPKNSKVIPIVIAAILLILVGAGSYFLATKKSQPVQTNSLSISPTAVQSNDTSPATANWKTYIDTKLNFSIKYPSDVAISRTLPEGGVELSLASELQKDFRERSISLNIYYRGDKNVTPEETQQSECAKPCTDVAEKTTINNASGVKVVSTNSERYYLASTNNNVVGIFLVFPDTTSKSFQTDLEKFRQILSTFKFTPTQ